MQTQPPRRKKRRKWPWILLVLALLLIAGLTLSARRTAAQSLTEEIAQRRDIVTYYSFSGSLIPVTDEVQTAKDTLKVKELYVKEGDRVAEGDALLRGSDGTRVYAACSGTIEELYAQLDDTLQPGSQIARIVDYDALEVSVDVDEYDIDAIQEGKQGEVYLNALDVSVPGTVTEIARNATTESGVSYYPVKLEVEAAQNVRSGMSVEVNILNQQALGAVSLSLDALSYDEYNRPFVYLKDAEGKLTAQYVETGVSDGQYIEILSGVSEGDAVYYQTNDLARFFAMQQRMMGVESR
ncbi:MAG TPA: HlyD family efflux transporter periplasmic adaptor subunit [Candidatus Limiplasma pullicola]|nr:HlyD family efflux transporter periplasmic adaptor subunit [Candidatus Limiplasma pullicola]